MKKCFVLCMLILVVFTVSVQGNDMQTAFRNADEKLKANGFLLSEEVEEIWREEQTPDIEEKFSLLSSSEKNAILEELNEARTDAIKSSDTFGTSIKDDLERSAYQSGVLQNKLLKITREIAKKHGIKAGDIFMIEGLATLERLEKAKQE